MRNAFSFSSALILLAMPIGCGDSTNHPVDAPVVHDAPTDTGSGSNGSGSATVDSSWDEGGEVRLEWMAFGSAFGPPNRTRATAFFFKGTPVHYPFPTIPGCTRYDTTSGTAPTLWPLAQDPNRQYMDVGHVIIADADGAGYGSGDPTGATPPIPLDFPNGPMGKCSTTTTQACLGTGQAGCPTGETCIAPKDFLDRAYTGPYKFSGISLSNFGHTYIHDHTAYNVTLTGSTEWPAQTFDKALYMPDYFTLTSPDASVDKVPLGAVGSGPMTFTFGEPASQPGLPPGAEVTTLLAFTNNNPPVLLCVLDSTSGSITVSADDMDYVRATVPGGSRLLRQNVVHQMRELTDGVTHTHRRIDFISVWCYNYGFSVP